MINNTDDRAAEIARLNGLLKAAQTEAALLDAAQIELDKAQTVLHAENVQLRKEIERLRAPAGDAMEVASAAEALAEIEQLLPYTWRSMSDFDAVLADIASHMAARETAAEERGRQGERRALFVSLTLSRQAGERDGRHEGIEMAVRYHDVAMDSCADIEAYEKAQWHSDAADDLRALLATAPKEEG
jgi:hypothetical protein